MNGIFCVLAKMAYKYGTEGAGLPSYRYICEMEVPVELIEMNSCKEENEDKC